MATAQTPALRPPMNRTRAAAFAAAGALFTLGAVLIPMRGATATPASTGTPEWHDGLTAGQIVQYGSAAVEIR